MKTETTKPESVPFPAPETAAVEEAPKKRRSKRAKKSEPTEAPESAQEAPGEQEAADGAQEPASAESAPQALHEAHDAEAAAEAAQEPASDDAEPGPDATPPKCGTRSTRKAKAPSADAAPAKRKRSGKAGSKASAKANDATTLATLAERYLRSLEDDGRSAATVGAYKSDLGIAMAHFGEDAAITAITPRRIATFNASDAVTLTRHGTPKATPTVERTRRVLRLALSFAEEQGLLPTADAK